MFVLALVHTFPFIINEINMGMMEETWRTSGIYASGVAALIPQAYLTFFSIGPLRNRYYEFFKATHIFTALLFVIMFFVHTDHILTSWFVFTHFSQILGVC